MSQNFKAGENQEEVSSAIDRIFKIFKASMAQIKTPFILTGPSGSGKSKNIQSLCASNDIDFLEINAAQLTKEGTSGNSLSKALSPMLNKGDKLMVVFVDEFDKLFISGNSNCNLAHETTNGVQNEFLKVLESGTTSVFADYGQYKDINMDKVLFIFAGAFNGQNNITLDDLRNFGVKTEFIGRVGLVYNLEKLTKNDLITILEESQLLETYLKLFKGDDSPSREQVISDITVFIEKFYEKNDIGARLVNTLINQYYIKGGKLGFEEAKQSAFQERIDF